MSTILVSKTLAAITCLLLIVTSTIGVAQGREDRDQAKVKRLISRVGSISKPLKHHVERLREEGESDGEISEACLELIHEFKAVKSSRGAKAARLWCKLAAAELEIDQLMGEAEDGNLDEQKLKKKTLKLIDADINFEATEIVLIDDAEELEEFKQELLERHETREEEMAEMLSEFFAELDGEDEEDDWEADDEEVRESLRKALANYTPIPPVQLTDAEISVARKWDFDSRVLPVLKTACYDCHGDGSNDGNLDIESLLTETPLVKNRERWQHVIAQVENRTMPPPDTNQVSDTDRKILAAWLRDQIENFDYGSIRNPGFESAKRLTHEEYNNTIRDLIGIDLRPADRLPADLSTNRGFDNSGNSLFLNDGLLERYVGLAEFVIQQAYPLHNRNTQQEKAWRILFVQTPDAGVSESVAAQAIFKNFLPKVYRAKIEANEVDLMVKRFGAYRDGEQTFAAAILKCVQAALVSPRFLMRVEATQTTDHAFQINAWDLANRLSYFLWASMPDDRLFRLAESGQLLDKETLDAEVKRMLRDPKAESLGSSFAGQWLGFEHLGSRIRLDPIDNPWCTDSLMEAMKQETGLFFVSLLRENRPLRNLIDSKYTYLNEELAGFYRIRGVRGEQMRRVQLKSKQRGGILAQSSVLAVTSFPDRTSPVTRGAWLLTNVLGKRPPNPPPNVSQFNEELESHDSLTQRQKMELHRRNPTCAACHDQIDPLGFALENYDLFGRYRSHSEDDHKIDARSRLPDGTEIDGLIGLKRYVLEQKQTEVLTQLTRKMLAYALGRQLEYYDEAAVQKIVSAVVTDDWKMQTLVLQIVKSYPFQNKQLSEVRK